MNDRIDDGLARWAYDNGEDPVDHAVVRAREEIEAAGWVLEGRAKDPSAFPGYGATPTADSLARKIVARLMDVGWAPPEVRKEDGHEPRDG